MRNYLEELRRRFRSKPDYMEGDPAPTPEEALREMGMEDCLPDYSLEDSYTLADD